MNIWSYVEDIRYQDLLVRTFVDLIGKRYLNEPMGAQTGVVKVQGTKLKTSYHFSLWKEFGYKQRHQYGCC